MKTSRKYVHTIGMIGGVSLHVHIINRISLACLAQRSFKYIFRIKLDYFEGRVRLCYVCIYYNIYKYIAYVFIDTYSVRFT